MVGGGESVSGLVLVEGETVSWYVIATAIDVCGFLERIWTPCRFLSLPTPRTADVDEDDGFDSADRFNGSWDVDGEPGAVGDFGEVKWDALGSFFAST